MLAVLFDREIGVAQMNLALGEAIAHLNYLIEAGRLSCSKDDDGVNWYQTIDKSVAKRSNRSHHKDAAPMEV